MLKKREYETKRYKNRYNFTNELYQEDVEIILEDVEFAWRKRDVALVVNLWRNNYTFREICDRFKKREADEIFLLLLHLSRQKRIEKREGFIWG